MTDLGSRPSRYAPAPTTPSPGACFAMTTSSSGNGRLALHLALLIPVLLGMVLGWSSVTIEDSTGPYAAPRPVSCGPAWFPNLDKVSAAGVPRCLAVGGPRGVLAVGLLGIGALGMVYTAPLGRRSEKNSPQPQGN